MELLTSHSSSAATQDMYGDTVLHTTARRDDVDIPDALLPSVGEVDFEASK